MQKLSFSKTQDTPEIILDPQSQLFSFVGRSFPENTFEFYEPVIQWLREYFQSRRECRLHMQLEYLNSSSLKSFFDIFEILDDSVHRQGSKITINWIYDPENDIALETGENMDEDFSGVEFVYTPRQADELT
ncbi:MAG: DUF1987 domain-containing protein [Campylobacterota bacterium]